MYYNKLINKDKDKIIVKISVFTLLIDLLIFMCVFSKVRADTGKRYSKNNVVYIQIINYTLPSIKILNLDKVDMSENSYSIKKLALSLIGVDIYNPEKILGREVSCFDSDAAESKMTFNSSENNSSSSGDFSLNSSDISKVSSENKNSNDTSNAVLPAYDPKLKKPLDESKPEVLIYHSHTFESYKPCKNDSSDPKKSVCAVGDEIAKDLEQNYGISAINDNTVNCIDYNKSYIRSGELLDNYLKKYGDFKMIIDLHRDSEVSQNNLDLKINGENVAKFMFVMTRKNPHFDKNMMIVNGLASISNKLFPSLCRGVDYYDYGINYYNQQKSNNALLLEVGSNLNTLDEAKGTSKYIARIIAEYLNGKK